ncbi:hypothetical protein HNR46_001876 [Haloferula luteola]|uniref:Uncharacterized protein n=1 Tax=Haloferula luteola TaxID=595692 RepID=A0A840UZU8_9BACT|nr:hypothetical protein [Haloferula luteola]MBB5351637.1 hypothetical protein [Haloferula luteola]
MPISTLTDFHHWLLAEETAGAPFILLDTGDVARPACAAAIARHLNEFDESSGGNWVSLGSEVIETIAADPAQRRLLGLVDSAPSGPTPHIDPITSVLVALAHRGRIVINHPSATDLLAEIPHGFRAALGLPGDGGEHFHIILDPNGFPQRCLAPLVADSFLEWLHHQQAA